MGSSWQDHVGCCRTALASRSGGPAKRRAAALHAAPRAAGGPRRRREDTLAQPSCSRARREPGPMTRPGSYVSWKSWLGSRLTRPVSRASCSMLSQCEPGQPESCPHAHESQDNDGREDVELSHVGVPLSSVPIEHVPVASRFDAGGLERNVLAALVVGAFRCSLAPVFVRRSQKCRGWTRLRTPSGCATRSAGVYARRRAAAIDAR